MNKRVYASWAHIVEPEEKAALPISLLLRDGQGFIG